MEGKGRGEGREGKEKGRGGGRIRGRGEGRGGRVTMGQTSLIDAASTVGLYRSITICNVY